MIRQVLACVGTACVLAAASPTAQSPSTPFRGTAPIIPGTVENENFDDGGEGIAYHDTTPGNFGGVYRQTDVDLAANTNGTGYLVGWASPGEWLKYTVNVAMASTYKVTFRVASLGLGATFHLEVNGANITGALRVPDTGGWLNWQSVTATIPMLSGIQVLRLVFDTSGPTAVGNFDSMRFDLLTVPSPAGTTPTPVSTPAPAPVTPPPVTTPAPGTVPTTTPVAAPTPTTSNPTTSTPAAPTSYSAISDRVVRQKPGLPALGSAGFTFTDPTFGSRMLRVTDGFTRSVAGVSYRTPSETPNRAWNTASNRFYVTSTDGTIIPYAFDAGMMRASRIPGAQDGGLILSFDLEPEFSALDPDVIFSRSSQYDHAVVTMYNFSTNAYSVVADVRTLVPGVDNNGRTYLRGVETGTRSGVEYMTFAFGGTSQDQDRYAICFPVGNLAGRQIVDTIASTVNGMPTNIPLGFRIHAVAIDQSGRFVSIGPTVGDIAAGKAPNYIWDTVTNTFTPLTRSPGGHAALGFGTQINNPDDSDAMDFMIRDLSAPDSTRVLISPFPSPANFGISSHASWSNAQPSALVPVVAGMFRYGGNAAQWREWDDEIIAIRTDNVESRVWRFAHHRSDYNHNGAGDTNAFWYTPRPNVSVDGRWAIFTSNWEKTLGDDTREVNKRQDVFLVELKGASTSATTPTSPTTPTTTPTTPTTTPTTPTTMPAAPVTPPVSTPPPAAPSQAPTLSGVAWTNVVAAAPNVLQKTKGCDQCPDAGAISQQQIISGTGYVEFSVTTNVSGGPSMFVGLGNATTVSSPPTPAQMDFAFGIWPTGYSIFERGVWKYDGAFSAGDVFRVSIEAGAVVKYYRNGALVYTSKASPSGYPYALATTIYYKGASVNNAVIKTP